MGWRRRVGSGGAGGRKGRLEEEAEVGLRSLPLEAVVEGDRDGEGPVCTCDIGRRWYLVAIGCG